MQNRNESRAERIRLALSDAFNPSRLIVTDESARHAGHAGAAPGGETHYAVEVISSAFEGMNRVARQRAVYGLLDGEFKSGLHALSLILCTPVEAEVL